MPFIKLNFALIAGLVFMAATNGVQGIPGVAEVRDAADLCIPIPPQMCSSNDDCTTCDYQCLQVGVSISGAPPIQQGACVPQCAGGTKTCTGVADCASCDLTSPLLGGLTYTCTAGLCVPSILTVL
ncbi:hypothetical protein C8T65DRAFT_675328, partial [Cerioporus squamosus]